MSNTTKRIIIGVLISILISVNFQSKVFASPSQQNEIKRPWFLIQESSEDETACDYTMAAEFAKIEKAQIYNSLQPDQIVVMYKEILNMDHYCLKAYRGLANADRDPSDGIAILKALTTEEGIQIPEIYLVIGEQYLDLKNWMEAFNAFEKARQLQGGGVGRCIAAGMGVILFNTGQTYAADIAFIHSALESPEIWTCPDIRSLVYDIYLTRFSVEYLNQITIDENPPYISSFLSENVSLDMINSRTFTFELDRNMDIRYVIRSNYRNAAENAVNQGRLDTGLFYLVFGAKLRNDEERLNKNSVLHRIDI